ncbi:MAG: L-threonylcarbamoyladenylate synthase [Pseudomonadota bacterium]
MRRTRHLNADAAGIAEAAALLAGGGLVAFPTETVYGLGADARNAAAIAALYAAKGRPARNPLIVHVPDLAAAGRLALVGAIARSLADRFWPGPLTLVLPLRADAGLAPAVTPGLAPAVTPGPVPILAEGHATVGLRVPAVDIARAMIVAADCPVAAPSANPSGRVSPTTAAHVLDPETGLGGKIDAVLDAGPCVVGVESTILAVEEVAGQVRLLRPGGLAVEDLAAALSAMPRRPRFDLTAAEDEMAGDAVLAAPGLMESHYASAARLRLEAMAPMAGEAWLGFGPDPAEAIAAPVRDTLSAAGDVAEAAARLFAVLRRVDAAMQHDGVIAVAPVPAVGLGRAVRDRLARAAAPRPGT